MRRLGLFILGLALVTSCSKEEEEPKVVLDEPAVPMTSQDMTGEFEGEWDNMTEPTKGKITVNNEYIIIDELPAEGILKGLIEDINAAYLVHPEIKENLADSIGNFFFASSYKYPKTGLEIKYQLDSYSDPFYTTSICSIKNVWSETSTVINIDYEQPHTGETIVIDPAEPNTISFGVEADGVPYRVDLVSKHHECIAEFNMNTGLWRLQYWFKAYRFINLQTGQKKDIQLVYDWPRRHNKEDTIPLAFYATKLKGPIEERVIFH